MSAKIKATASAALGWLKRSPFVQGLLAGVLVAFFFILAIWASFWLIHLLPWPAAT